MNNVTENYNRYVVTYFPDPDTWESASSLIIDAPSVEVLGERLHEALISIKVEEADAAYIVRNGFWFFTNCNKVDFVAHPLTSEEKEKRVENHRNTSPSNSENDYELTMVAKVGKYDEAINLAKTYAGTLEDIKVEHDVHLAYAIDGQERADRITLKIPYEALEKRGRITGLEKALAKEQREDPDNFPILRWLLVKIMGAKEY